MVWSMKKLMLYLEKVLNKTYEEQSYNCPVKGERNGRAINMRLNRLDTSDKSSHGNNSGRRKKIAQQDAYKGVTIYKGHEKHHIWTNAILCSTNIFASKLLLNRFPHINLSRSPKKIQQLCAVNMGAGEQSFQFLDASWS